MFHWFSRHKGFQENVNFISSVNWLQAHCYIKGLLSLDLLLAVPLVMDNISNYNTTKRLLQFVRALNCLHIDCADRCCQTVHWYTSWSLL